MVCVFLLHCVFFFLNNLPTPLQFEKIRYMFNCMSYILLTYTVWGIFLYLRWGFKRRETMSNYIVICRMKVLGNFRLMPEVDIEKFQSYAQVRYGGTPVFCLR